MAGINITSYAAFDALSQHWAIWDESVTTDLCDWVVVAMIKNVNRYIGGDIDANCDIGNLIVVGKKAVLTPGVGTFSATATLIAKQSSSDPVDGSAPWLNDTASSKYERNNYYYWESGYGGANFGSLETVYVYDTAEDFYAALDNNQITPISETCCFDIYINGTDKPNIWANWTVGESISPVLLTPRVWVGVQDLIALVPEFVDDPETGLKIPNPGAWYVSSAGSYSYAGAYQNTFLSIQQAFEKYLNPVSRVEHWGFDGDPEFVTLYLQMIRQGDEGLTGIGDLFYVRINKNGTATVRAVSGSSDTPGFYSVVRLHYGEPDYVIPDDSKNYASGTNADGTGDGRYRTPPDREFIDDNAGLGFDGNAVLTKTYSVSATTLQNVGQKLWSQSYFNVLKIQNNPIENIVSVKAFPFETAGTSEEIKVGDIAFGVNGDKIPTVLKKHIGSVTYSGVFGSYLDLNPYTIIKINLPYCGLVQLDACDLFNSELSVDYIIDMITGECMAMLTLDGIPYMNVKGQMGIDMPLTASDRAQTELKTLSASMSVIGGATGQLMSGNILGAAYSGVSGAASLVGTDYNTQRTGSQAPACASYENHGVFLLVERPLQLLADVDSVGYKHLHGRPCHKYLSFNQLNGFVAVDRRTDINIAMTKEENTILEQLLTEGVYI